MKPLVSICIPVRNMAATIERTIASALRQDYDTLEVLVLDNQSTDRTFEIATGVHDSRLRVLRNERNLGAYGNHNRCLELARGEWVKFLHGDDELLPECVSRLVETLQSVPADTALIGCGAIQYDQHNTEVSRTWIPARTIVMRRAPARDFMLAGNFFGTPTMTFLHRRRMLDIGGFDLALEPIADGDGWIKLRTHYAAACVPQHLVIVRDDPPPDTAGKARIVKRCLEHSLRLIHKWHALDELYGAFPLLTTPYGRWLHYEMFRFWDEALRFLLHADPSVLRLLVSSLRSDHAEWPTLAFYCAKRLTLHRCTDFRGVPWPELLHPLILPEPSCAAR